MTKQILFPAIVESVASRKDKTLSIKLGSNELTPDKAAMVMSMNQEACYVYLKANEIQNDETEMIDGLEADLYDNKKSQSKRIRDVLWLNWRQNNEGFPDFKDYYRHKTEQIITHYKSKLE